MAESRTVDHYVVDTHAIFWYLTASPKLGQQARHVFERAAKGEAILYVPVIVLAELYFLNEKAGQPIDFLKEYIRLEQSGLFMFVALQPQDVLDFANDSEVTEMHDRLIVGVARRLDATCLTRDRSILASNLVQVVW